MILPVNLLPWRHTGRQRRQRYRIGIMVSVVALLISGFWGRGSLLNQQVVVLQKQGNALENQHNKLQDILHQQQRDLPQRESQYREPEREKERQHRILRWGDILTTLSNKFPESSGLISINWQPGILTLAGYTAEIEELETIEAMLKQLPGAFHVRAGPVSYQADQGLVYSFILEEMGGAFVSR
jgi:Tfp pilus assembly protein PilN